MQKLLIGLALAVTVSVGLSVAAQAGTLDDVKKKGFVQCGVNQGLPGFGNPDSSGNYTGFDSTIAARSPLPSSTIRAR